MKVSAGSALVHLGNIIAVYASDMLRFVTIFLRMMFVIAPNFHIRPRRHQTLIALVNHSKKAAYSRRGWSSSAVAFRWLNIFCKTNFKSERNQNEFNSLSNARNVGLAVV